MQFLIPFLDEDYLAEWETNWDYNILYPGCGPNSTYTSGYSFIDMSIDTFTTQCMPSYHWI